MKISLKTPTFHYSLAAKILSCQATVRLVYQLDYQGIKVLKIQESGTLEATAHLVFVNFQWTGVQEKSINEKSSRLLLMVFLQTIVYQYKNRIQTLDLHQIRKLKIIIHTPYFKLPDTKFKSRLTVNQKGLLGMPAGMQLSLSSKTKHKVDHCNSW